MNSSHPSPSPPDSIEHAAATWVIRRDRGLTAAEQDELSQWLAADARHGEALALHRWGWDELDRLTGLQTSLSPIADPDLLAPRKTRMRFLSRKLYWILPPVLAAAAAVAAGFFLRSAPPVPTTAAGNTAATRTLAAPCERREIGDGSLVHLNRGAAVRVVLTPSQRRVEIERGEASFTVARDTARPFIVAARGFEVRAVGTAFNVRLEPAGIEVLVTEGRVQLNRPGAPAADGRAIANLLLAAGDCAMLRNDPATPPQVSALSPAQIDARLAWRPTLLDFTDAPLAEIVEEFNRRNPVELVLADPALRTLKLSATFRSDNVEGFVRLMESDFGMRADWRGDGAIALFRAR